MKVEDINEISKGILISYIKATLCEECFNAIKETLSCPCKSGIEPEFLGAALGYLSPNFFEINKKDLKDES